METNLVTKTLILLSTTLLIWQINAHAESINWKLSNPETQNVDSNILQKLHQELKNGTHGYSPCNFYKYGPFRPYVPVRN